MLVHLLIFLGGHLKINIGTDSGNFIQLAIYHDQHSKMTAIFKETTLLVKELLLIYNN